MNGEEMLIGGASALFVNSLWSNMPGHEQFVRKLEIEKSPLAFIEHHHYGLASLLVTKGVDEKYKNYIYGFAGGMFLSELLQDHPFGIGKSPEEMRGNAVLTLLLVCLNLI